MGNIWSVESSNSHNLQILNSVDCDTALYISKEIVKTIIKKVEKINNLKMTKDYKKYGLYPGQEIFYKGVITSGGIHPAVYLYNGIIMEVGSAPESCKNITGFTKSYFGLNSLEEYIKYGKEVRKSKTWKVDTGKDGDKKIILQRLKRAYKTLGVQDFKIFSNNCIPTTHYVVFGERLYNFPSGVKFIEFNEKL